ncbi:MAG: kelch-like protein, partial [Geobacteraceae bacterium]
NPGIWTQTGNLNFARDLHTATLLPNGKVIVAGGSRDSSLLVQSELYDPATGTWTLIDSLNFARDSHTATLLSNGEVLVAGGFGENTSLFQSELY